MARLMLRCFSPQPAARMMGDEKSLASFVLDLETAVPNHKFVDRGQRPGAATLHARQRIDHAVLHQAIAAGRYKRGIGLQFRSDVSLAMIAIEDDHDRAR